VTSCEIDILNVLDDAIDQAAEGLPDYLTSDELLEFSGLSGRMTKREMGILLAGAGPKSKPKRIDGKVTKVYAGSEILAAIRARRGASTAVPAINPDSGDVGGSVTGLKAAATRAKAVEKPTVAVTDAPVRRTVAVRTKAPAQDADPAEAVAAVDLAAGAGLTQPASTVRAVSAETGSSIIVVAFPLGTPTDEIRRVTAALGIA
jgi:hypothetical protein